MGPSSRSAVIGAVTDITFGCPARRVARALGAEKDVTVYRYILGRSPSFFRLASSCLGVPHIADTFYIFYNNVTGKVMDSGDRALASAMKSAWHAFARGESPTLPSSFSTRAWPTWDNANEETFFFNEEPTVIANYDE